MRELPAAETTPSARMTFSSPGPITAIILSEQEQGWNGHPGVDQPLHQDVRFPPEVAAPHAHDGGQAYAYTHGAKAYGHRDAGAIDDPTEDVASQVVSAKVELRTGGF